MTDFADLVCPRCRGKLTKQANLICGKCKTAYLVKNGIPLLWLTSVSNLKARRMIGKELEFSRNFIIGKDQKDKQKDDFYWRNRKTSYASKKFERHGLEPCLKLPPKDKRDWSKLKILNVGCGLGEDTAWLLKKGSRKVICTDISWDFLSQVKKKFRWTKRKPLGYFQADGNNLPIADNSFDLVFMSSALHHLPQPYAFLKNIDRVAPMIIATLEPADMGGFKSLLKLIGGRREYHNLATHRLNVKKIKVILNKIGYEVNIKTNFVYFPFRLLHRYLDNHLVVNSYFFFVINPEFIF